jgi:hypothetical protein
MTEVDWLLDQFAQTLDERDEEIVALRGRLAERRQHPTGETQEETSRDA